VTAESVEYDEAIALRTLIEADPRLSKRVGIGAAPAGSDGKPIAPPYVVLTGSNLAEQTDRFSSPVGSRRPSWILHAVGASELAAVAVLGWVDARLRPGGRGVTPIVPGRATKPIARLERPGNAEDNAVQPSVWYAIAVYGFESNPARTTT
jgi:hypothetical protein